MPDPRNIIDAETPAVRDALTEIVRIVLAGGGSLHPGVTMRERDGAMTVLCADVPGAAPDRPLFDVPREMLVPVDDAPWRDSPDELVLLSPPRGISPLQHDLLDLHVALYNACGKLPQTTAGHPRVALADEPGVMAALRQLRPEAGVADDDDAQGDEEAPMHVPRAVSVFLATRVFGLAPVDAPAGGSAAEPPPRQRVLLPLIDLLNHHPRGAALNVDARAMTPAVSRPKTTAECFANYGHRRDSLDLAINYAYLDTATHIVHCPPLSVQVPGCGSVRVRAARHRRAPYAHVDPPRVAMDQDGVTLSHLVFRPPTAGRWELPVVMALESRALQQGVAPAAAHAAGQDGARLIAERVVGLLTTLRDTAAARAQVNAAAEVLRGASDHQLAVVRRCSPMLDR